MKTMLEVAKSCLNIPYLWGGKNPLTGLDCSGFVEWILMSIGFDPPGVTNAQHLHDWLLTLEKNSKGSFLDAGTICFYGESVSSITHVTMMINAHQIIEAGGGGSKTIDLNMAKSSGACVRIRPFGHRKDLVMVITPNYPDWVLNES